MPPELCSVSYPDFTEAIMICVKEGVNCNISHSDMRSAFHNLGIRPGDWFLLIMKAVSPLDGKTYYFIEKYLHFGAAISCSHFQRFSNSVAHIVSKKTGKKLVNYLDDYLFIQALRLLCNLQVKQFLEICRIINFPVSMEKTLWVTNCLTFLGFLIYTLNQVVCIPDDKVSRVVSHISEIINKDSKKVTLKQLQKLCGFLNFLCRCVVPGHAFTRRLYAYTAGNLKPHHHIRVNAEMRCDLEMWMVFLQDGSAYCRPFIDYAITIQATEIKMYSDSSKNPRLGFGVICNQSWLFGQWDEQFMLQNDPSIQYLELFTLVAGC